jgi:hypothetical protein
MKSNDANDAMDNPQAISLPLGKGRSGVKLKKRCKRCKTKIRELPPSALSRFKQLKKMRDKSCFNVLLHNSYIHFKKNWCIFDKTYVIQITA